MKQHRAEHLDIDTDEWVVQCEGRRVSKQNLF